MTDKRKVPRIDLFCCNADGEIVIVSKVWWAFSKTHAAVSLYAGRGIADKTLRLVTRNVYPKATHPPAMLDDMRDTVAHLWALRHGVSDYVVLHKEPKISTLYHPSELNQQENHNVV